MHDETTTPDNGTDNAEPQSPPAKNSSTDVITHRIVVVALSLTVLFTGLNMTVLQALGREIPPALANLGMTAVGALSMTLGYIMRPR